MRNRVILTLLLAGLVALAGCSGGPSGTTAAPDDTTTAALPSDMPAGVTESGIQNATALLNAHVASLNETTYRFELTGSSGTPNQTVTTTIRASVGAERTLIRQNSSARTAETWKTGTYTLTKRSQGEQTRYVVSQGFPGTGLQDPEQLQRLLTTYFTAANFSDVSATTANGQRYVKLTATDANESFWGKSDVTNLDATALVTPDGRVSSVTFSAAVNRSGTRATVGLSFDLLKTGGVTPEKPSWTNEVAQVKASIVSDGDVLAIENTGGSAVAANATFTVVVNESYTRVRLPTELAPGESTYVTASVSGGEMNATVHAEKPSDGAYDFSSSRRVFVQGQFGQTVVRLLLAP